MDIFMQECNDLWGAALGCKCVNIENMNKF